MAVPLALDHPTRLTRTKVQEVTKNFFAEFGFSYFQYLRCFADGSVSLLATHTDCLEYFGGLSNSPVVFSSFEKEHANAHSYWFLWDEELPEFPVSVAREQFNIHNGLTLVRRSKNYYDMIAVGLPAEQMNPGSFYLNKLQAIEQFIREFDQDNKELLQLMNKNPIFLSELHRDINYLNICLVDGKVVVKGKNGLTHVTAQELACLRLLVDGASHKVIAKELVVSPRTVETYLQRVKLRTGFSSRSDIERMMLLSSAS